MLGERPHTCSRCSAGGSPPAASQGEGSSGGCVGGGGASSPFDGSSATVSGVLR